MGLTLYTTKKLKKGYKWVPGFEGRYSCNKSGRVMSYCHDKINGRNMKVIKRPDGYKYIRFRLDDKYTHKYIHRIVCETFIDTLVGEMEVNHIDSNPSNNHVNNLEIVTRQENAQHAARYGGLRPGENHHSSKISDKTRRKIFLASRLGLSQLSIASCCGLSQQAVSKIVRAYS